MPLYNNILLSRKNDGKGDEGPSQKGNSNASMKFLQDHLLSKRRSQQQTTQLSKPLKATATNDRSQYIKLSNQIISESVLHKLRENNWDPRDEYDPMVPNSYEVLQAEFLKSEELRQASIKLALSNKKINSSLLDVLDKLDNEEENDDDQNCAGKQQPTRGTAIAPPASLVNSGSHVKFAEDINSRAPTTDSQPPTQSSEKPADGGSIAAKIMSKMGYKVGQGLGKDKQGISSPLEVEKSGLNAGRIVPASVGPKQKADLTCASLMDVKEEKPNDNKMAELLRESTRVLLLQNMVGPGEVDDDLEAETKEECKKYGDVVKCLIYEIPNKRVADNEAVRIFVEFRKVESAIKAVTDLNGRYFGGRIVRASFYNVERFNKYELGPIGGGGS